MSLKSRLMLRYWKCVECSSRMNKSDKGYVCSQCGLINEISTHDEEHFDFNSIQTNCKSSSSAITFTGPGSYKYKRVLQRTCGNQSDQQERKIKNEFRDLFAKQNKHLKTNTIPENVFNDGASLAIYVKSSLNKIIKVDNKIGFYLACIINSAMSSGIPLKTPQIAKMYKIEESKITSGFKLLHSANMSSKKVTCNSKKVAKEILSDTLNKDKTAVYIESYSSYFEFNEKHKKLCLSILKTINEKRLCNPNCKPSTKAIAIVLFISKVHSINTDLSKIPSQEKVSKNTYDKYYNDLVKNVDNFSEIFDAYNIDISEISFKTKRKTKNESV